MSQILLPAVFFPNIAYLCLIYQHEAANIVVNERYEKQSFRSRMSLVGANGPFNLSVPVVRPKGKDSLVSEVTLSSAENWRKDHLRGIESAYRNTPYFEYYWDAVRTIISNDHDSLLSINQASTDFLIDKMGLSCQLTYSQENEDWDFRFFDELCNPKKQSFEGRRYIQAFEERHGFVGNLSGLDLLFNEGPNAITILHESI